jgi:hypothetical protein
MILILALLLVAGCGREKRVNEVRDLRLAGQADSARALALSLLNENANRMDLWHEFARSSVEEVRLRPNEENHADDLDILVQAGLVCGAVYQQKKHEPDREWRDTGKLLFAEIARQISNQITAMNTQMQSANYLKPLLTPVGPDTLIPRGPEIRAQQALVNYRSGARNLLFWPVVLRRLLENLPEVNPGTATLLASQLDEAITPWAQSLDLDPAYMGGIQQRARVTIDNALNHAQQDLHDLGYLLPQTIIENGVSQ